MAFPDDGDHIVPGMLAPLVVRDGIGRHVEPNVWVVHAILVGAHLELEHVRPVVVAGGVEALPLLRSRDGSSSA